MPRNRDPYQALGVSPGISDAELRAAYHRLVQRHHPDHNDGSPESARRFEEIQQAYARVREQRARVPHAAEPSARVAVDPDVDARVRDLERELREARAARERARRAAAEAAAASAGEKRPSDEELGYVKTDDSLAKWLDDAGEELAKRWRRLRDQ